MNVWFWVSSFSTQCWFSPERDGESFYLHKSESSSIIAKLIKWCGFMWLTLKFKINWGLYAINYSIKELIPFSLYFSWADYILTIIIATTKVCGLRLQWMIALTYNICKVIPLLFLFLYLLVWYFVSVPAPT